MKYVVRINNKDYEVVVEKGQANLVNTTEVVAAPAATAAPLAAPTAAPATPVTAAAAPIQAEGSTSVKSPMPGTILDVKTAVGQSVKSGDVLVVLEAMKMENEIVAPSDGTVAGIQVAVGDSVEAGATLATLN